MNPHQASQLIRRHRLIVGVCSLVIIIVVTLVASGTIGVGILVLAGVCVGVAAILMFAMEQPYHH